MSERVEIGAGVFFGTLVAGPAFVASMLLGLAHFQPGSMSGGGGLALLPVVMAAALPFGAVLAVVPVLLGATLMGQLGRWNEGARLPITWALVGALAAGVPSWLLDGGQEATASFAATGALCALTARAKTRWTAEPLAPRYGRA